MGFFIGIDPGRNGGIAVIDHKRYIHKLIAMPEKETDLVQEFKQLAQYQNAIAVVERVNGFIGKSHPGSRMFNFGMNYGAIRILLVAYNIKFYAVSPVTWMNELELTRCGVCSRDKGWKKHLKETAVSLFRDRLRSRVVTYSNSDALLIAEYARRKYSENFQKIV